MTPSTIQLYIIAAKLFFKFLAQQNLLNGVPLTQVQQVLRHTNINTTLIYSHAIERMKNKSEQTVADVILINISVYIPIIALLIIQSMVLSK